MDKELEVSAVPGATLEEEICKTLIEGFGLNLGEREGGDCDRGLKEVLQDNVIRLNLEESLSVLDLNETSPNISETKSDLDNEVVIGQCPRCVGGYLKRQCIVCHGVGMIQEEVCPRCKGSGIYVYHPSRYYEGKKCYHCNGSGQYKHIVAKK